MSRVQESWGDVTDTGTASPAPDGTTPSIDQDVEVALVQAASLMRLNQVRSDPLFAGVDGHGTTVVVIDTGADLDHTFFGPSTNGVSNRIVFQTNFTGANGGNANDGHGHGTHVAGIVGSQDATYRGMAPGTSFIILRVLNNSGSGTSTDIEEAFQWVVANRSSYNIVAVSMSIGVRFTNYNSDTNTPIADEVQTLWNAGIPSVLAAGNDYSFFGSPGVNYLAATPFAWGVASTLDSANTFSSFSQRSSTMTEIAAPGSNITSAWLNNSIATLSGTSMATPMISGLVALAQDLSQEITGGLRMTPTALLDIMRTTGDTITGGATVPRVDALDLLNGVVSHWQQSTAGDDNVYGWRGNDNLFGQGGDDVIRGNLGNDTIDGGPGTDGALFSGQRSAYSLTDLGGGSLRVVGPDGTDTLSGIERLGFAGVTGSIPVAAAGDFDGGESWDYAWRDPGAFMSLWEYDAAAQEVTEAGLGIVGFSWQILASDHFSNASTDQMLVRSVPDGTMALWWVSGGQLTGVNIGRVWNGINYLATGEFTDSGGADVADFLVTNTGDHHLYNWWIDAGNHLQGIDLGAVWSGKSLVGTGAFTLNGGTDFLVANAGDHHLYDWWIDPVSRTLQGYDLGAAWSNVGYIASGAFTANGGGNDNFLVFNQSDRHLYDWWIDPVSHTLQGIDLGAAWNNIQFLAAGDFHDNAPNEQFLVRNTADSHLYVWWIDPVSHTLQGYDLGARPGIELVDTGDFNDANGGNDEWLVRNTADGHFYEWWISNNQLSGADLGNAWYEV